MDRYFVVLPSGERYGPANPNVLNRWIAEGRVTPDTLMENAVTGERCLAKQVPWANFGQPVHPMPPSFPSPPAHVPVLLDPATERLEPAWTVASLLVTAVSWLTCASPVGLVCAGVGLFLSIVGRSRRERGSGCGLGLSLVTLLVLGGLTLVLARWPGR